MGGSQSTRKITVPNESAHIIKVSDSVIERLKNVDTASTGNSVLKPPLPTNFTGNATAIATVPAYAGSLTSVQVLQEKEKQLKENDAYWANRVRSLEASQAKNSRLMEQEFAKTVAEIEKALPKIPTKLSEAPCSDKKAKVLECYKQNPKQILVCAKEVAEFADCVDLKRLATP